MTRPLRLLGGAGLVLAAAAVFVLPFTLMLLPNPRPIRVDRAEGQPTGVYLDAAGAVYRVFPYGDRLDVFPRDAAVVPTRTTVLIRYRNLGSLGGYALHRFPSGAEVGATYRTHEAAQLLELDPGVLSAGRYYVTKTREGMWGGTDFVYFSVEETATPL